MPRLRTKTKAEPTYLLDCVLLPTVLPTDFGEAQAARNRGTLEQTLYQDVSSRLAALLLRLRANTHSDVNRNDARELAEHLGVYRETVTAALNNLRKGDLVTVGRKHVHLLDIPGLEKKASC